MLGVVAKLTELSLDLKTEMHKSDAECSLCGCNGLKVNFVAPCHGDSSLDVLTIITHPISKQASIKRMQQI